MPSHKNRSFLCGSPLDKQLITQASAMEADFVHFDLASLVPQSQKEDARMALKSHYLIGFEMPSAIRINSMETVDGLRDLVFLSDRHISPDILILPKVTDVSQVDLVSTILKQQPETSKIFAVVENNRFLLQLAGLPEAPPALAGLIFGAVDFCADMGMSVSHAATLPVRFEIARIAKEFGIAAIDTPCFRDDDETEVARQSSEAKSLGYDGKIAIVPSHVPIINDCFTPGGK